MATLTDMPKGKELEEFIAAHFQCAGYYVEKNIIEQDVNQVLELDVVATNYLSGAPEKTLLEVKGGGWGFPELFKVCGWMRYLGVDNAAFVVSDVPDNKDIDFVQKKMQPMDLSVVHIENLDKTADAFIDLGINLVCDDTMLGIWRFSYWIERKLIEYLRTYRKSNKDKQGPAAALKYYDLVNDGIFFISSLWLRTNKLYEAYQEHPRLTLAASAEMAGHGYDAENPVDNDCIKAALYKAEYPLLQACMYLEHRARISILKAAVDHLCAGGTADSVKPIDDWGIDLLPDTFTDGLKWLGQQNNCDLYPYFWQVYLWGWGGFYLRDRQDQEFDLLSKQTGVPINEIPAALSALDQMFPISGGWNAKVSTSECCFVKMVPCYFQGLGAFLRLQINTIEHYSELGYSDYTEKDLVRWHNSVVHFLDKK